MMKLQNELQISYKRQESKAEMYLRSFLDDDDLLINKNMLQNYVVCPKVPPKLRNNERGNKDYYDPKIVSFGPYHHGKVELRAAQRIKTKVMRNFILKHGKSIQDLYIKVFELNEYARSCYVDGSTSAYDDEVFALMMLQDGCFILGYIEATISDKMDFILNIVRDLGISELKYLYQDLLLLENQIPYRILNILMTNIYEENEGLTMIKSYLNWTHWGSFQTEDTLDEDMEEPFHLLGLLKTLISKASDHVETETENVDVNVTRHLQLFGSVSELQANGIYFKPSNSISLYSAIKEKPISISLRDVEFRTGFLTAELKLPPLIFTSDSLVYYTNLIAFELFDFNDFTVTSYISFMNSLIDNLEDVKALRSKGIILHSMTTDEEVFKMLKEISATNCPQNWSIYEGVRQDIERHYNSKIKIWLAEVRHKYFSQPWSMINFVFALIVALILSFVQTFYTIYPRKC